LAIKYMRVGLSRYTMQERREKSDPKNVGLEETSTATTRSSFCFTGQAIDEFPATSSCACLRSTTTAAIVTTDD